MATREPAPPEKGPWSTSSLVRHVRSDLADHVSARALYERLVPSLVQAARRMVGDPNVAEELAQDALSTLMTHPGVPDFASGTSEARSWARRVVVNAALSHLREASRKGKHHALLSQIVTSETTPEATPAEAEEERLERARRLRICQALRHEYYGAALASVAESTKPEMIESYELIAHQGRSPAEVDDLQGLKKGHASKRYNRVMAKLLGAMGLPDDEQGGEQSRNLVRLLADDHGRSSSHA